MKPDLDDLFITTFTGRRVYPFRMTAEDVDIRDIAHSLAMQCRYNGHTREFYSVAQHSWAVSRGCDEEDALWGLLHDAAEAYIGDMAKPIKHSGRMGEFRMLEADIMDAVCAAFDLPPKRPDSVTYADLVELVSEAQRFMPNHGWIADVPVEPRLMIENAMGPRQAEDQFLRRFRELTE